MIDTDYFVIAVLSAIAAFDVWKWRDGKPNNTISHRVNLLCRTYPWCGIILLIFTTLLAGHFLLPYNYHWIWPQPVFVK